MQKRTECPPLTIKIPPPYNKISDKRRPRVHCAACGGGRAFLFCPPGYGAGGGGGGGGGGGAAGGGGGAGGGWGGVWGKNKIDIFLF